MQSDIKGLFEQYGGVMKTSELREHGFNDRRIKKVIMDGIVEKIRCGYYQYIGDESFTGAAMMAKLFHDGIETGQCWTMHLRESSNFRNWNFLNANGESSSQQKNKLEFPVVIKRIVAFMEPIYTAV